jgi:hypothetical protein
MDERFRRKGPLVAGAVVAAIIFLCVTLCFMGALGTMFLRSSAVVVPQVQPPAGAEGVVPPQVYHGSWGGGRSGVGVLGFLGFGAVMFFGILLLLGVGRFVLGPRRCAPPHGGLHPAGKGWKGHRHPWGPWGWHAHGKEWQEGDDPDADEDLAYDEAE